MNRSEWSDLEEATNNWNVATDVCIVGAGAAGLYLAAELSRKGIDVTLLEAGPASTISSTAIGFNPEFGIDPYPGATKGRFFGVGGSTSKWGGLLMPHTRHNVRKDDPFRQEWSSIVNRVERHTSAVLNRLGYLRDSSFETYPRLRLKDIIHLWEHAGIDIQASLYIPFRRKNMVGMLQNNTSGNPPKIYFNAVAKDWRFQSVSSDSKRISTVIAVSRNGNRISVTARRFVIAAGAIESARILLEINSMVGGMGLKPDAAVGCFLADHLSLPIADVAEVDVPRTIRFFAPYFEGDWMRGFRFVPSIKKGTKPSFFAHFIFSQEGAGFTVAKEILGSLQERRWPNIKLGSFLNGLSGLGRLGIQRFVFSRLYVSPKSPICLQMDMEQIRDRYNNVSLSSTVDDFGRPLVKINWSITDADFVSIKESAKEILSKWPSGYMGMPSLIPRPIDREVNKPYDAYHPVGTCRMGVDSDAVVDIDLKVWGADNLWVVSTAVLPGAGTANPTFTMLCLAHDLVGILSRPY